MWARLDTLAHMTVVELRQYTLAPGRRDELIDLFEAEFVEAQERCGIHVIGTFRDLADTQRFVWIRSFPDMERRAQSLADFYGGPVWRRHREAANATMLDSDNVLLLRPAWNGGGFSVTSERDPAGAETGIVEVGIVPFAEPVSEASVMYFTAEVAPRLRASGATLFACLVSEHSINTFPALPVREGENVLVWCAGFPSPAVHRGATAARSEFDRVTSAWPRKEADGPELLTLAPTSGSQLTGSSASRFVLGPLAGRFA
jgi:hypothetical protein